MTSAQNKASFQEVIDEAFNKGHYAALRVHFRPDFVEHQFGLHATIEGMQKHIEFLRAAFPDLSLTIEETVADGDKLWVRMTGRGTNRGGFMGPPNGKPFKIAVFDVCRFEDGKIVEHWGCSDRFAMMAQLGRLPWQEPIPD